jgi:hypothetical protein
MMAAKKYPRTIRGMKIEQAISTEVCRIAIKSPQR